MWDVVGAEFGKKGKASSFSFLLAGDFLKGWNSPLSSASGRFAPIASRQVPAPDLHAPLALTKKAMLFLIKPIGAICGWPQSHVGQPELYLCSPNSFPRRPGLPPWTSSSLRGRGWAGDPVQTCGKVHRAPAIHTMPFPLTGKGTPDRKV